LLKKIKLKKDSRQFTKTLPSQASKPLGRAKYVVTLSNTTKLEVKELPAMQLT
jgi:hypothetical protein